jgi:hypothetical protein
VRWDEREQGGGTRESGGVTECHDDGGREGNLLATNKREENNSNAPSIQTQGETETDSRDGERESDGEII